MASLEMIAHEKHLANSIHTLSSTQHLTLCKTSLWSPLTIVGTRPQWAQMCASGLDTALNYLRETEPLSLEPVAISENRLCTVRCENSPLVMVQSVHVATSQFHSPLSRSDTASQQAIQQPFDALNEREMEILRLLEAGYSNKSIADTLIIAASTVKWYLKQIYSKFGVHSRTQAVAHARQYGLIS